jgi:hypothetical protein
MGPDDLLDALSIVPKNGAVTIKCLRGGAVNERSDYAR